MFKTFAYRKENITKIIVTTTKRITICLLKNFLKGVKKYSTIVLDEMNQERSEKKTFDISYSFTYAFCRIC